MTENVRVRYEVGPVDAVLLSHDQHPDEAATLLGARQVLPLHFEGWGHFTQGRDTLPTTGLTVPALGAWLTLKP